MTGPSSHAAVRLVYRLPASLTRYAIGSGQQSAVALSRRKPFAGFRSPPVASPFPVPETARHGSRLVASVSVAERDTPGWDEPR